MRYSKSVLIVCAWIFCSAGSPIPPGEDSPEQARDVLKRSKTTTATYALYARSKITIPGRAPRDVWSAEFNSGPWHRVETPDYRIVANCFAGTGAVLDVKTGEVVTSPGIALSACGIDTRLDLKSLRHLGQVDTQFGKADRIEVIDEESVRTYDVLDTGALIAEKYYYNTEEKPLVIVSEAHAVVNVLPKLQIFDTASLAYSVVPSRYKRAPETNQ